MAGKTAVIWDERFMRHEMGLLHPETPRRLRAIKDVLDGDGVGREVVRLEPRAATREEISFIHDSDYIDKIEATDGIEQSFLDPDTSTNKFTWDAAINSVGATIICADEVNKGSYRNSFAFVRPPGHHAERGRAMGFCIFNNVAIAADWLIRERGLERVAIFDFDVHHCNGTQHAFYNRDDIFVASVHRNNFYPGTGAVDEIGEGRGRGATLNVPIDACSGDEVYKRIIGNQILPEIERYGPQIILISAGYDAHEDDPLGGMRVTTKCFRWMMKEICALASSCCDSKVSCVLEGGYDLPAIKESVEVQLEEMVI